MSRVGSQNQSRVDSSSTSKNSKNVSIRDPVAVVTFSSSSKHRSWLETRNSTVDHVKAAAANCMNVGSTSAQLREAIRVMETQNAEMEEILSEPHHIVSNNDLALIMKSVLSSASDSKQSAIMANRKPPVLRSLLRARGEKVPAYADRVGTEYLPVASSSVPYAALQQELSDMIQCNKERHAQYLKLVLDVERQQQQLQDRWSKM